MSTIRFLSMYYTPVYDALVVSIWLLFGDAISPQPRFRHTQFNRVECVEYRGDRTEIMVVVVAEANVIYLCSVHFKGELVLY